LAKKKVVFLSSAHHPLDDRIFYHLAESLKDEMEVAIVSSCAELNEVVDGKIVFATKEFNHSKKSKINFFLDWVLGFEPDILICSEPLPILAANRYKSKSTKPCKIIYDVTEFYPSKKNLENTKGLKRFILRVLMKSLNRYASGKADAFIFGEYDKSLYYRSLFKSKPYSFVTYYPDLKYIQPEQKKVSNPFVLGYTGKFTEEKGILNFAHTLNKLKDQLNPESFHVVMIGWFPFAKEKEAFEKLTNGLSLEIRDSVPYTDFAESLKDVDLFFDLRESDKENNLCLPIKLYFFSALHKPMIYTNLQAIRRAHPDLKHCILSDPSDHTSISNKIIQLIQDVEIYEGMCSQSELFSKEFQWNAIKNDFVKFIKEV
jgi:glycosyltransferase involved in cell wall biosynthesis